MEGVLLVHTPPVPAVEPSKIESPTHTWSGPLTPATKICKVSLHPVSGIVYDTVVNGPGGATGERPINVPEVASIEPTAGMLLDHTPPINDTAYVTALPEQTVVGPTIGPGAGLTVTIFDAVKVPQVVVMAYTIVVMPAPTPVIEPVEEPTVATEGALLDHTPPGEPVGLV